MEHSKNLSCTPDFRCWEIIFTSHRYLLGCSGGVFRGIAQNPWDGDDEILFTSLDKAVDNSRLSIKTIYQDYLSMPTLNHRPKKKVASPKTNYL